MKSPWKYQKNEVGVMRRVPRMTNLLRNLRLRRNSAGEELEWVQTEALIGFIAIISE
jgi:hypothetical protein